MQVAFGRARPDEPMSAGADKFLLFLSAFMVVFYTKYDVMYMYTKLDRSTHVKAVFLIIINSS